jgi:hypothetical protein
MAVRATKNPADDAGSITVSTCDAGSGAAPHAILIAQAAQYGRLGCMGAKYLPTIKDLKASQRFLQKQRPLTKFKKSPENQPAKKGKK